MTDVEAFWQWWEKRESQLSALSGQELVEVASTRLAVVNPSLSIEVSNKSPNTTTPRELVITASGVAEAFADACRVARESKASEAWKVTALKPPRGFDFVTEGLDSLAKSQWCFVPLSREISDGTRMLGLKIETSEQDSELLSRNTMLANIIREGVGEVLLSCCSHLSHRPKRTLGAFRLAELGDFLYSWILANDSEQLGSWLPPYEVVSSEALGDGR